MRGTGTTTQQLKSALPGALFITNTPSTEYHKILCNRLGRSDITLRNVQLLKQPEAVFNMKFSEIIVDHATPDTADNHRGYIAIVMSCTEQPDPNRMGMQINVANNFIREQA